MSGTLPRRAGILFLAAIILAFASQPARAAQARSAPQSAAPDWKALDAQALSYFRAYLRFDTSDPPGNTSAAITFLSRILERNGIRIDTFTSARGQVNLVARLPGPPATRPLLLMSHADVVPAVASDWTHSPFDGDVARGYVWGRGAIDNKAYGIMSLMTLLALKRGHVALRRGVEMMVNADEEAGGKYGCGWMVKHHWEAIDPAFAVNEGGDGTPRWLGSRGLAFRVAVSEKRAMWLRLIAHGRAGHGSIPNPDNPNRILIDGLHRLLAQAPGARLTPVFDAEMLALAPRMRFPASFELSHLGWPFMMDVAARGPLASDTAQALARDTIAPTMLSAGVKANVIPSTAEATLDCRLLPTTSARAFLDRVKRIVGDPRISIELLQSPVNAPPSPASGEAWNAIQSVIAHDFKNAFAVPALTAGATDSRFLRAAGVPAYGFVPIVLSRHEAVRIHGVDERLSLENFYRGLRATYDLALALCAAPH